MYHDVESRYHEVVVMTMYHDVESRYHEVVAVVGGGEYICTMEYGGTVMWGVWRYCDVGSMEVP